MADILNSPFPFEASRRRIYRAEAHRKRFAELWNDFLEDEPYSPGVDVNDEGEGSIWVGLEYPVPWELSLELGEMLYQLNLRGGHP